MNCENREKNFRDRALEPLNPIGQYIGKSNQIWYDSLPDEWKPRVIYDEAGNPIFTNPETPWGYGIPGWGTLPGAIDFQINS